MAFNPNPTGVFPNIITTGVMPSGSYGLTSDVTGVFIPYSDLESYDYSVATGSYSGDLRQLCYSINEAMCDWYVAQVTADKPANMTYARSASIPSDSLIRKTYTIVVNLNLPDTSIADEA